MSLDPEFGHTYDISNVQPFGVVSNIVYLIPPVSKEGLFGRVVRGRKKRINKTAVFF